MKSVFISGTSIGTAWVMPSSMRGSRCLFFFSILQRLRELRGAPDELFLEIDHGTDVRCHESGVVGFLVG